MKGIEIDDATPEGFLSFDLGDILEVLGDEDLKCDWSCFFEDGLGEDLSRLHEITSNKERIDSAEIRKLAKQIVQTIDGEFECYAKQSSTPWLIIKAVDSSLFVVL